MIEKDTVRLLRECDSGIKMGLSSISDVQDYVASESMSNILDNCKKEHEQLKNDIQSLLDEYHDDGKDPAAVTKGMSWVKTNVKLAISDSDETIADLMTDGCNMGVKSLSRYLNQYAAADERSKDITKRLIKSEEQLAVGMRQFL